MGAILSGEYIDNRMAELTAILGHDGPASPPSRPCARCGRHRGNGHKWCAACRAEARKEYNAEYHQRTYERKSPAQVSATRRRAVNARWRPSAGPRV